MLYQLSYFRKIFQELVRETSFLMFGIAKIGIFSFSPKYFWNKCKKDSLSHFLMCRDDGEEFQVGIRIIYEAVGVAFGAIMAKAG